MTPQEQILDQLVDIRRRMSNLGPGLIDVEFNQQAAALRQLVDGIDVEAAIDEHIQSKAAAAAQAAAGVRPITPAPNPTTPAAAQLPAPAPHAAPAPAVAAPAASPTAAAKPPKQGWRQSLKNRVSVMLGSNKNQPTPAAAQPTPAAPQPAAPAAPAPATPPAPAPTAPTQPAPPPAAPTPNPKPKPQKSPKPAPAPAAAATQPSWLQRTKTWFKDRADTLSNRNDAKEAIKEMRKQAKQRKVAALSTGNAVAHSAGSTSSTIMETAVRSSNGVGSTALGLGIVAAGGWLAYEALRDDKPQQRER